MPLRPLLVIALVLLSPAVRAETPEAAKAALAGFYAAGEARAERPALALSTRLAGLYAAKDRPSPPAGNPLLGGAEAEIADLKLSEALFSGGRMMIVAEFRSGETGHLVVYTFVEGDGEKGKNWVLDDAASMGGDDPFVLSKLLTPAPKLELGRVPPPEPDTAPASTAAPPAITPDTPPAAPPTAAEAPTPAAEKAPPKPPEPAPTAAPSASPPPQPSASPAASPALPAPPNPPEKPDAALKLVAPPVPAVPVQ